MNCIENISLDVDDQEIKLVLVNKEDVSVLDVEYIITPKGNFIKVLSEYSHAAVFSKYLYDKYHDKGNYETTEGAAKLNEYGNIIYFGIRTDDLKCSGESYHSGCGLFLLPDDIHSITYEQKESINALVSTNFSRWNKEKPLFDITFSNIIGEEYSYNNQAITPSFTKNKAM